jgi:hypothetical protein
MSTDNPPKQHYTIQPDTWARLAAAFVNLIAAVLRGWERWG